MGILDTFHVFLWTCIQLRSSVGINRPSSTYPAMGFFVWVARLGIWKKIRREHLHIMNFNRIEECTRRNY